MVHKEVKKRLIEIIRNELNGFDGEDMGKYSFDIIGQTIERLTEKICKLFDESYELH